MPFTESHWSADVSRHCPSERQHAPIGGQQMTVAHVEPSPLYVLAGNVAQSNSEISKLIFSTTSSNRFRLTTVSAVQLTHGVLQSKG